MAVVSIQKRRPIGVILNKTEPCEIPPSRTQNLNPPRFSAGSGWEEHYFSDFVGLCENSCHDGYPDSHRLADSLAPSAKTLGRIHGWTLSRSDSAFGAIRQRIGFRGRRRHAGGDHQSHRERDSKREIFCHRNPLQVQLKARFAGCRIADCCESLRRSKYDLLRTRVSWLIIGRFPVSIPYVRHTHEGTRFNF